MTGDEKYLISQGIDKEVHVWDLSSSKKCIGDRRTQAIKTLVAGGRRNTFGRDSLGVFSSISAFDTVRCVNKSANDRLLVSGHSDGSVRLFSYPSTRPNSAYKEFNGHSQEGISGVLFSFEDEYFISLGRDDRTLIQWKILPNLTRSHLVAPFALPDAPAIPKKEGEEGEEEGNEDVQEEAPAAPFVPATPGTGMKFSRMVGVSMQSTFSAYCGMGDIVVAGGSDAIIIDSAGDQRYRNIL